MVKSNTLFKILVPSALALAVRWYQKQPTRQSPAADEINHLRSINKP